MAKVIVTKSKLDALNTAISEKCGTAAQRTLDGMAEAVSSIDLDLWSSDFLKIRRAVVTAGENSAATVADVKSCLASAASVSPNNFIGASLHAKESYSEGEVGRIIFYPNSNVDYYKIYQYSDGSWGTGRMSYDAVLPEGSVYDVFYWTLS